MNVGSLLTIQANKFPDRTALVFENKRFTYREFNQRSNRMAHEAQKTSSENGGDDD